MSNRRDTRLARQLREKQDRERREDAAKKRRTKITREVQDRLAARLDNGKDAG